MFGLATIPNIARNGFQLIAQENGCGHHLEGRDKMPDRTFGWGLPPGVKASDIPGNRPEDEEWERIVYGFYGIALFEDERKVFDTLSHAQESLLEKAIEYGIELGREEQKLIEAENKLYEDRANSEEAQPDESRD